MGNLITGSLIRVGFEYGIDRSAGDLSALSYFQDALIGCLYDSGAFSDLNIQISTGWLHDYMTITGITAFDFAQREDIGGYIQDVIQGCLPFVSISRRDAVIVDAIPQTQIGQAGVEQPEAGLSTGAPRSGQCDWNQMKISDYFACQFGVTPTSAAVIGVGVGLLGVVLISKLAR